MKTITFYFLLATLCIFVSCDSTVQYDVYVENQTTKPIRIEYKTIHDKKGEITEKVILPNGKIERIISTKNIEPIDGNTWTTAEHCNLVAEYIKGFSENTPSTLEWCSEKVQFQKVDIGQAEFKVVYTEADF